MAGSVAARELVRRIVAQHGIVVFSKTYCPYSMDAKAVLRSTTKEIAANASEENVHVLELDRRGDESDIQVGSTQNGSTFV